MEYTVYTFGGGEILTGVFNAIAMSLNGHADSLWEPLKRLGLILGTFWAALYALYGDQVKVFTHWIVPMTVFMNLLFVPTTTVWIHDPVHHYHQKVDNVPYGLAALAGHVSTISYHITGKIESFFSLPDDLRYQKSGFLFASDILQKAKTFHITNSDLAENMKSFVGQCVLYDAMLGRKYTINDLRNSDDIWGLVSAHPSPARSFVWRDLKLPDQPRGRSNIIACTEGVIKFNQLWASEITHAANLFGKKIFDKAGVINPRAELLKYLPLAYGQLGHIAKDASEIIKQQMMIYSIVDSMESHSTALGNVPNFAARRAYLQQRSTYETLGAMAGETLPVMKAVLEAIIYTFFLFVIPLVLLPFGYRFLLTWAQSILWLQLWAPLYAVLNYIMTITATSKTMAAIGISNPQGITIASAVGVANVNADIAAMAGYLSLSIPFLSIALVKGVGSFVHMASHLGNVAQSSAGMAASEVTSGNLSYGNFSEGNSQISNSNMLTHSIAASYRAASTHMQEGRSEMTTMADGSQISNIGTSNLPISLNVAESQSNQLSQMASSSQQKALSLSESSSQSLSSAARSAVNLSETLSKLESSGDSTSHGISTEQSQAIHHGKNLVRDFSHQTGIEEGKAAQMLANAAFGNKGGTGLFSGSLGIDGKISAAEQEQYNQAQKFVEDHNFQEAMRSAAQASKQLSHSLNDEKARHLAEETSGSYEQGINQRNEAAKSFRQAEDYSNQANFTRANSATINYNANQQFSEWLANQPADNTNGGRIGTHGAAHIMAASPGQTMAYAQRFMAEQGMLPSNPVSSTNQNLKASYEQEQAPQMYAVTKDSLNEVRAQAEDITHHSNKNIKAPYEQEQVQQTHAVTKSSSAAVKAQAGDISNDSNQGKAIRSEVMAMQDEHNQAIKTESSSILTHGAEVKRAVHAEQDKGVTIRVIGKAGKEVVGVGSDILDAGKKIWNSGESQQK